MKNKAKCKEELQKEAKIKQEEAKKETIKQKVAKERALQAQKQKEAQKAQELEKDQTISALLRQSLCHFMSFYCRLIKIYLMFIKSSNIVR